MTTRLLLSTMMLLGAGAAAPAAGQEDAPLRERFFADSTRSDTTVAHTDSDWTPFFEHAGVAFSIIHYRRADSRSGGVVLRLANENDYAVRYRLRLGFLSSKAGTGEVWRSGRAEGVLAAGQMKTGSSDGLFWVPFTDGSSIAEIRLPEYEIARVPE